MDAHATLLQQTPPESPPDADPPYVDERLLVAPRECLPCYLARLLRSMGCSGNLSHLLRWQQSASPTARLVLRRLDRLGAECDCMALRRGFRLSWRNGLAGDAPAGACQGVAYRSAAPCLWWEPTPRWHAPDDPGHGELGGDAW